MLQKFIWTSGGALSNILQEANSLQQQTRIKAKLDNTMSTTGDEGSPMSAKEKNKSLLEKSVITSSECEFSIRDLDDLDDDLNEYSDDDEEEEAEEEEEEEEEEDDDDEEEEDEALQTSDEEESSEIARESSSTSKAAVAAASSESQKLSSPESIERKLPLKNLVDEQTSSQQKHQYIPPLMPIEDDNLTQAGKR